MTHVMALHTGTEHNLQILFASFRILAFECPKSIRMCVRVINHILLLILLLLHFPFICSPFLVSADGCFSLILFSAHFSQNINAIWKLDLSKMVINFLATKWQFRTKGRHTQHRRTILWREWKKRVRAFASAGETSQPKIFQTKVNTQINNAQWIGIEVRKRKSKQLTHTHTHTDLWRWSKMKKICARERSLKTSKCTRETEWTI